ncbi:hypothetical protein A3L04_05075 [Thermococcus chitonophagus]|uniref:Nitrosopumilus output domain-containing protein n=1 Tax=Thermococcus chitonophagus TaxID=54262 RepID=A0A160VWZ1_9EURY|nr:NitrOD5 domain-containing protein [Thermococcus chitonophagus]ASJ16490.1 hypothetical protein A3L04_05075 [Thermococcus chitonophagus]CUX78511.1 hypothetical protein CHITON_1732 [Thermococcus chitonophagus]
MSKGQEILVRALANALDKVSPGLKAVLETHLRVSLGEGLEVAYSDPKKFKEAVAKLFGEYSSRLLEMVVIDQVKDVLGGSEPPNTLEELVEILKEVYGE